MYSRRGFKNNLKKYKLISEAYKNKLKRFLGYSLHHQAQCLQFAFRSQSFFSLVFLDVLGKFEARSFLGYFSGKKKDPNPNFLVWMSSGGVGVFDVKGVGAKSSICPLKSRETKLFGGISRDFARDIPRAPEKFEKKCLCSIGIFSVFSKDFEGSAGIESPWKLSGFP